MRTVYPPNDASLKVLQETTKPCATCRQAKPLTEFYRRTDRRKAQPKTYSSSCKACSDEKTRLSRERNPGRQEAINRAATRRLRDQAFEVYGGTQCRCCGETRRVFLAFDHVEDDGAARRREVMAQKGGGGHAELRELRRLGWPPGVLQVLCHNCNFAKREGVCPHQLRAEVGPDASGRNSEAAGVPAGDESQGLAVVVEQAAEVA